MRRIQKYIKEEKFPMKKLFALALIMTSAFLVSACLGPERGRDVEIYIPDEFPEEEITLTMWHAFGDANMALLQKIFDDFEELYPNVTVEQLPQGGYDGLRESTVQGIVAGVTPDIVMGYPDHFVEYLEGNALVPLDEYIEHETWGTDIDDFVPGFLEENRQYLDGKQYSLPFAKSTEMVVYNKTVFDYFGIEFSMVEAMTWDEIEDLAAEINWDTDAIEELVLAQHRATFRDPHLINIDSAANFFINSTRQWDGGYTTPEGEILVDDPNTKAMLSYFKGLFDEEIVSFPIEWDEQYGSVPFKDGRVLMSQGSTAGTRHNIPDQEDGRFGIFEMGIMPAVQKNEVGEGPRSAQQQGPNIAIMADTTDAERLAAWLLIEFMTNAENTAFFAMNTGYVPVRQSAFETETYQDFLDVTYRWEDGEELSYDEQDQLPFAMAARVAYAQVDDYQFDPAFVGRVTSSRARQEAELAFEAVYAGTRTVDQAIQRMLTQLGG